MLIKRVNVLDHGYIELLDMMGSDQTVVNAARVSYLSQWGNPEKDRKLIHFLMRNEHMSPFEMVEFMFRVNMPFPAYVQTLRHRTGSFNVVSRRYTAEELEFYCPDVLRGQSIRNKQASSDNLITVINGVSVKEFFEQLVKDSLTKYNQLLEAGVAREQARMVLPMNLYSKFYFKIDLRNLLHFIWLRNSPEAQYEIRVYAEVIERWISELLPITYEAYVKYKKNFKWDLVYGKEGNK